MGCAAPGEPGGGRLVPTGYATGSTVRGFLQSSSQSLWTLLECAKRSAGSRDVQGHGAAVCGEERREAPRGDRRELAAGGRALVGRMCFDKCPLSSEATSSPGTGRAQARAEARAEAAQASSPDPPSAAHPSVAQGGRGLVRSPLLSPITPHPLGSNLGNFPFSGRV